MESKVVAITGGNSGIGLAIANQYLQMGYQVAVLARRKPQSHWLMEHGANVLYSQGDVSKSSDIDTFYREIKNHWGRLDIVIANAGIARARAIEEETDESLTECFDINIKGVFFTVQKALPLLRDGAAITLVSSIQANKGSGVWASYGASKAAVRSLARSFAEALGQRGIRVNCLSPGVTKTPIFDTFGIESDVLDETLAQVAQATPLQRLGEVDDIARAAIYLNSEAASFVTGADLQVDGGLAQI